jgi:hypothetical protein
LASCFAKRFGNPPFSKVVVEQYVLYLAQPFSKVVVEQYVLYLAQPFSKVVVDKSGLILSLYIK